VCGRTQNTDSHLCIKCPCDLVGWRGDLAKVASWWRLGPGRAEGVSVAGGGPRARRKSSGVDCTCPRLGSGEAWSRPSNGPILDLVAPIRPLQLCADGGYQLRFRSLEGTPNYGPRQISLSILKQLEQKFLNGSPILQYCMHTTSCWWTWSNKMLKCLKDRERWLKGVNESLIYFSFVFGYCSNQNPKALSHTKTSWEVHTSNGD
jgi:hypothetical protein